MEWIHLPFGRDHGTMASCFEYSDGLSGCITCTKFLNHLSFRFLEVLWSIELVIEGWLCHVMCS
jgi:hypothetical protein